MLGPKAPQPVEYYPPASVAGCLGIFFLALGGVFAFVLGLGARELFRSSAGWLPAIPILATMLLFMLAGFWVSFRMLRNVFKPLPVLRLDAHGITEFSRGGPSRLTPWSDTGATSMEWSPGKSSTKYLKLELGRGEARHFSLLGIAVPLEVLQIKIMEFQKAYRTSTLPPQAADGDPVR